MTLVALVYESKKDIPSSLTELYQMFIELLMGKWDSNRQISSAFDAPMKTAFLGRLAMTMQFERLDTISEHRAIAIADDFFRESATLSGVDSRQFIQGIIDRSHVVVPTGAGEVRFSHMTFQEYFCAEALSLDKTSDEAISGWFGDDWWSEVLFFLAGRRRDITGLMDALLRSDYRDAETRLTKLMTLGSMLQAGYLTKRDAKIRGTLFGAEHFSECYSDLIDLIGRYASEKAKVKLSRVMVVDLLRHLFASSYSSTYLLEPLRLAANALPKGSGGLSARFFLGCALNRLGDPDLLIDVATDPEMVDASMFLIARSELSEAQKGFSDDQKASYKRFRRRMEQFRGSLKRELSTVFSQKARGLATPLSATAVSHRPVAAKRGRGRPR